MQRLFRLLEAACGFASEGMETSPCSRSAKISLCALASYDERRNVRKRAVSGLIGMSQQHVTFLRVISTTMQVIPHVLEGSGDFGRGQFERQSSLKLR